MDIESKNERQIVTLSQEARKAIAQKDWSVVEEKANYILQIEDENAEGLFLLGFMNKIKGNIDIAIQLFERAVNSEKTRYDIAIELANLYSKNRKNEEAATILQQYEKYINDSSLYSNIAGSIYVEIGLPQKAFHLFKRANEIQPNVDVIQANLAACSVYVGEIDNAKQIYRNLLDRFPAHQRNHYQLSRLTKAKDNEHVILMKNILKKSNMSPEKNIFLYYAIGKELEDLECWDESFKYYEMGGNAVSSVIKYDVREDIGIVEKIISECNQNWMKENELKHSEASSDPTPIFIVGLPRTGSTLTERILSSHSDVQTIGETLFFHLALFNNAGIKNRNEMNLKNLESIFNVKPHEVAKTYIDKISYRLDNSSYFVEKMPLNFLYVGFIAAAWPEAKIIHLRRSPMDTCFSMYKQLFTFDYKYSYSLKDLGKYYISYCKMVEHWKSILGKRFIDIDYESMVSDPVVETRNLLKSLDLNFEEACLDFHQNSTPSTTASSVQVRQKIYSTSVNRWENYSEYLCELKKYLCQNGIDA
ncbi:MAG: sulfotransferase [Gammaproteobacteria bacterium]|nr:sulfotransferase [Gammaproteobacteria bacterium]MDH5629394.1 sulfotransferase [Gammaproteobacteria bacterium]